MYERDKRSWIPDQERLIRELTKRGVPTIGVCFGHQIANTALFGTVEHVGATAGLIGTEVESVPCSTAYRWSCWWHATLS